jgi:hypothetical protein
MARTVAWPRETLHCGKQAFTAGGRLLFVRADRGFELKNQVKGVITAVAKTHHYWQAHIAGLRAA